MKTALFSIIISFLTFIISAQEINKEIIIDDEKPFLLGLINKEGLTSNSYQEWFTKNHDSYELDYSTINQIKSILSEYEITLFMGTWCGDSKKEVPRFYKILEACNFPEDQLTAIALSRKPDMYKQSPNHFEAGLNIHRVPTFIFYKNGKEVNRIVEHPVETLEKDILNIITTKTYKSNYQIVTTINTILRNDGLNGLKKRQKKLIRSYKSNVSSMSELNTYGRILYTTNRLVEAIEVCKINAKLFPDNPRTFHSLAIVLNANGETTKAISVLEKSLKEFPENENLTEFLESLKTR